MAEVAGLAVGVMALFVEIMESYKAAIPEMHQQRGRTIVIKFCVEDARLSEVKRLLTRVTESYKGTTTLEPEQGFIVQRTFTNLSEMLLDTQHRFEERGINRTGKSETSKSLSNFENTIQDLSRLNDALEDCISMYSMQEQRKIPRPIQDVETSFDSPSLTSDSLMNDSCNVSIEGLKAFGDKLFKSYSLSRTFRRAAARLTVWRDGFRFPFSQIELVLGTAEYLYESLAAKFAELIYMLYNMINTAITEACEVPPKLPAYLGRSIERIKSTAAVMKFSIEDTVGIEEQRDYARLFYESEFEEDEKLEKLVKDDINGHCADLYRLIGAIDVAGTRHSWLVRRGQQTRSPEELTKSNISNEMASIVRSLQKELLMTYRIPPKTAKELLEANVESASKLVSNVKNLQERAKAPKKVLFRGSSQPVVSQLSQLKQGLEDELTRLAKFENAVGRELDGSLARRNIRMQEAVLFALTYLSLVLGRAILPTEMTTRAFSSPKHQKIKDLTSTQNAFEEFKQINDSLTALIHPIKTGDPPPLLKPPFEPKHALDSPSRLAVHRSSSTY